MTTYVNGVEVEVEVEEEQKPINLVELGINIIECADWITPLALALMGYTRVLFYSESLEEACFVHMEWRMRGVDCMMYGNEFMGYFILGRARKDS